MWHGRAPLHECALVVLFQAQLLLDAAQLLGEEVAPLVLADLLLHALPDLALQLAQLDLLLQQQQRGLRPARARAPAAPQPPRARLSSRPRPRRPLPPPPPSFHRSVRLSCCGSTSRAGQAMDAALYRLQRAAMSEVCRCRALGGAAEWTRGASGGAGAEQGPWRRDGRAPRGHAQLLQHLLQRGVGAAAHAGAHVRQVRQVLEVGAAGREAARARARAASAARLLQPRACWTPWPTRRPGRVPRTYTEPNHAGQAAGSSRPRIACTGPDAPRQQRRGRGRAARAPAQLLVVDGVHVQQLLERGDDLHGDRARLLRARIVRRVAQVLHRHAQRVLRAGRRAAPSLHSLLSRHAQTNALIAVGTKALSAHAAIRRPRILSSFF